MNLCDKFSPERLAEAVGRLRTGNYLHEDLLTAAAAYLREHPADNNEPVTNAALEAHGFAYDDEIEGYLIYCYQAMPLICSGEWTYCGSRINPPHNVRQLRRLLDALDAKRPSDNDEWRRMLVVGKRKDRDFWLRHTSDAGLYYWLHPERNEWIGEPDQITTPGFTTYADADKARQRAPVPPFA